MTDYTYSCVDCGETVTYKRAVKTGNQPRCQKCGKSRRNKMDWQKEKKRKAERKAAGATQQQQQWSAGAGTKPIPRIDQLVPLYLQVTDATGHAVEHTPQEWLELAAEFARLKSPRFVEFCTRKGAMR